MVACQLSMDIMGVHAAELIDGIESGGVATYMEAASEAAINLFILKTENQTGAATFCG
jgi:peroxiredoxin family protein